MSADAKSNWKTVEYSRRAFADLDEASTDQARQFKFTDDPVVVSEFLGRFQAAQKSVAGNPELFYPSALPADEVEDFNEGDKAKRLYEILTNSESPYEEKQSALNWLLTYDHASGIEWFHQQFQQNSSRYMGYRRYPSDAKFHQLLAASKESQAVIEDEIREKVEANGYCGNYAKLLSKVAPQRFLDFCQNEMERNPRSWYARQLAESRPSVELLQAIENGMKTAPNDHWYVPLVALLQNESTRKEALEFVDNCNLQHEFMGWWSTIGAHGTEKHRQRAIIELQKFELSNSKCDALYEIDQQIGLAEFDQYLKSLDEGSRRSFAQFTYYPYECYYGMKIDEDQLEFIKWVVRVDLESYAIEAMCEAWRGSEGDEKAAADLEQTLLDALRVPNYGSVLAVVNTLGQLFRSTQNQKIVEAIVDSEKTHFSDGTTNEHALECFARNLQLIGGEQAMAAAHSFWSRVDEAGLLNASFTRWLDQQWCKNGLTVDHFLEDLRSHGWPVNSTADDLYMTAWEEFNDRRQSAPSLGVYPQGFYESVMWALDATDMAVIAHGDFEDIIEALKNVSKGVFSIESVVVEDESVEFVCMNRLVRFEAESKYAFDDVGEIVDLANQLLTIDGDDQDAKDVKRFVLLPVSEDHRHCILFESPKRISPLVGKFFLQPPA